MEQSFSPEEARRQLDTAIDWGRYAKRFAYDDEQGEVYVEEENGGGEKTEVTKYLKAKLPLVGRWLGFGFPLGCCWMDQNRRRFSKLTTLSLSEFADDKGIRGVIVCFVRGILNGES